MPTLASTDGTPVAYTVEGREALPPLVLVHSASGDSQLWRLVTPLLAEKFHVYTLDRGDGAPSPEARPPDREAEDLLALLDLIRRPTFLVGYSSGAHVALHAAARSPFVAKLVLYEPPQINAENYRLAPERFCSLAAPTLFLVGENSPPDHREVTDRLYAFLPDSRIQLLEGQTHSAMLTAPESFARTLTRFLLGESAV